MKENRGFALIALEGILGMIATWLIFCSTILSENGILLCGSAVFLTLIIAWICTVASIEYGGEKKDPARSAE